MGVVNIGDVVLVLVILMWVAIVAGEVASFEAAAQLEYYW